MREYDGSRHYYARRCSTVSLNYASATALRRHYRRYATADDSAIAITITIGFPHKLQWSVIYFVSRYILYRAPIDTCYFISHCTCQLSAATVSLLRGEVNSLDTAVGIS